VVHRPCCRWWARVAAQGRTGAVRAFERDDDTRGTATFFHAATTPKNLMQPSGPSQDLSTSTNACPGPWFSRNVAEFGLRLVEVQGSPVAPNSPYTQSRLPARLVHGISNRRATAGQRPPIESTNLRSLTRSFGALLGQGRICPRPSQESQLPKTAMWYW
jgi:hypothetical protein